MLGRGVNFFGRYSAAYMVPLFVFLTGCASTDEDNLEAQADVVADVAAVVPDGAESLTDGESSEMKDGADTTEGSDVFQAPPAEWEEILVGTSGDIHRCRYLPGLGFRLVGDSGSVLRAVGDGWVREWSPYDTATLRDVTAGEDGSYHAVGHDGAWLVRDELGRWQAVNAGVDVNLHGIAGLPRAVVAVGVGGTIVRYQYGNFIQEPSLVTHTLYAISSPGNDRAFAVGDAGLALRRHTNYGECYDTSAGLCGTCDPEEEDACGAEGFCTALPGDEGTAYCVQRCGAGAASCPDGFVCTDAGGEGHCEPNSNITWESLQAAATVRLRDLFALDLSSMWAVGDQATIMRYKPSTKKWQLELSNDGQKRDLYAVTGGSGMVLAAGDDGVFVRHQSGANNSPDSWILVDNVEGPLLTTHRYQGIAIGSERVVAGGEAAALQIQVIPDQPFKDGQAHPYGAIFDMDFDGARGLAVGDGGVFIVWDEEGYGALDMDTDQPLYAAHLAADGSFIAAGAQGTLVHLSPEGVQTHIPTGTTEDLRGIHTEDDGSILVVGNRGVAIRIPPEKDTFIRENVDDPRDLMDLFVDGEHITAIGRGGAMFRYDGGSWAPVSSGTTVDLYAGAHGGGRSIVVGAHGMVIGWGTGESPQKLGEAPGVYHYGVEVDSSGAALVAGWAGTLTHVGADGTISSLEGPSKNTLRALAIREGNMIAAGDKGGMWKIGKSALFSAESGRD